jgi:enterobactin synthetase component D
LSNALITDRIAANTTADITEHLHGNGPMSLQNPFPEICTFAWQGRKLHQGGVHPLEVAIGDTFSAVNRRAEFLSGRRCAHLAMAEAGYPPLPILRERDRSPAWPLTIVGSISHGAAVAAALIGRRHRSLIGLGIDIENLQREIRSDITRHILTPWEIERWQVTTPTVSRVVRIIFSIKETIYKTFFPLQKVRLGFQDAEVTNITSTSFAARLLKNPVRFPVPVPMPLEGRLQLNDEFVFSALQLWEKQLLTGRPDHRSISQTRCAGCAHRADE